MSARIHLVGLGTLSALGFGRNEAFAGYDAGQTCIRFRSHCGKPTPVAPLAESARAKLESFLSGRPRYRDLDPTVQMALACSHEALLQAKWGSEADMGIAIGSSRGATHLLERYHAEFLASGGTRVPSPTSPTTTLGNLSSWVAQEAYAMGGAPGPATEISSTCSTSLYALGNGVAWLRAGMTQRFLAGGSEAPLTDFTVAQMRAVRVYSKDTEGEHPCRPCAADAGSRNTMVLGEGAGVAALERVEQGKEAPPGSLAVILGVGFSIERVSTGTSLSEEGTALQQSMARALANAGLTGVDAVVTHTPGTALGDRGELAAVRAILGETKPLLTSNKWMVGHTLGASGILGLEYALYLMDRGRAVPYPYPVAFETNLPKSIDRVLVNSVGFGGNAGSIILGRSRQSDNQ